MGRPKRKLFQTLGIVCEGVKTENFYLTDFIECEGLLKERFHIIPATVEEEPIQRANNKRPQKQLKKLTGQYHQLIESDPNDYNKFKAQPLCYVREAFMMKEELGCDEVWAMFDQDGHASHKEAFAYAEQNKVKIAFSSRSFEQWVLMHFEDGNKTFEKTECKKQNKQTATKKKANGCNKLIQCLDNAECLCGYIRRKHIPSYTKSDSKLYTKHLKPKLQDAICHAKQLRLNIGDSPIYEKNPYCNIDELITRMLAIGK